LADHGILKLSDQPIAAAVSAPKERT